MIDEEANLSVGNYILRRRIGNGSQSCVWLADSKISNIPCGVKVVPKRILDLPDVFNRFQREVSIMRQCNHPFITHFYESIEDEKNYYVFIEYADNGDLETLLSNRGSLPENMCRFFFAELLSALDYLHNECKVAHRDLKPQNILLDRYNNIRISDFGFSKSFDDLVPNMTTKCGTPTYAAPEVVIGRPYTKAADIWSLGVILYQMAVGKVPFEGTDMKSLLMKIIAQDPPFPPTLSPVLVDLLKRMLCRNPSKRITIKEITEHQWVVPAFVGEVNTIVTDLRANNVKFSIVNQPDPSQLQAERNQLIYTLCDKMEQARSILPANNIYYSQPNSLPSRYRVNIRPPSNANLWRGRDKDTNLRMMKCRSQSIYAMNRKLPTIVPTIVN